MRTFHLTGELIAVTRLYVTIISAQFTNFLRKIIPRTYPFIAEMIDACIALIFALLYNIKNNFGEVTCIGWSTALVKYNFQRWFGIGEFYFS